MKTRKTIKWIASILGASILVSTVVSCSSSEPAPNKYSPREERIMDYRKKFLKKQYDNLVKSTNNNFNGWKKEYDEVLQVAYNPYWNDLDVNKDWYQDWIPYIRNTSWNGFLVSMWDLECQETVEGYMMTNYRVRIYNSKTGDLLASSDQSEKLIVEYIQ